MVFPALAPARVRTLDPPPRRRAQAGRRNGRWRQVRKLTTVFGLVLVMTMGLVATVGRPQSARAAADSRVLVWNEETLESIRRLPPGPTAAARALAIVHAAIHDARAALAPGGGDP